MTGNGEKARRRRRTGHEVVILENAILRILREDNPQSVRHVFYRLVDAGVDCLVEKTEHGYKQVQNRMTKMRKNGRLPFGWVTDATRRGFFVNTFESPSDYLWHAAQFYRADVWGGAETYVEVWVESRSIAGLLQAECNRLAVPLYPCGGFASLSMTSEAAEFIRREADGRAVRIIYIGDFDPAGVTIDRKVIEELRYHLPDHDIEEHRIAVTEEQAAALPCKPRKASEKRNPEIKMTVEAEAIPAGDLRAMLRHTVEAYLPPDALASARVEEVNGRELIEDLAVKVA